MAFVVEDGSGLSNANSYASVSEMEAYLSDRNISHSHSEAHEQAALIFATDYLTVNYGRKWRGIVASSTQRLDWPRDYAYDDRGFLISGLPQAVKEAAIEIACDILTNSHTDPLSPSESDYGLKRISQKVGPLSEEKEFIGSLAKSGSRVYPKIEGLLSRLIKNGHFLERG